MRKSNWIIIGILIVASIVFLGLWFYLGFNETDSPTDIIIACVWWVVVIGVCFGIHHAEKRRCDTIRTAFLAPGAIYNCESGIVSINQNSSYLQTLQDILNKLQYNFEKAAIPNDSHLRFIGIVRTSKFSDNGNTWEGEFVLVNKPNNPLTFHNKAELEDCLKALQ